MKQGVYFSAIIVFLFSVFVSHEVFAQDRDYMKKDPVIADLYRKYQKTSRNSKEISLLNQMKSYALSKGYEEVLYYSCNMLYYGVAKSNYKLRDSVAKETVAFLEEHASPFFAAMFVANNRSLKELKDYILNWKDSLTSQYHTQFIKEEDRSSWRVDNYIYLSYPIDLIKNDFEYFLWRKNRDYYTENLDAVLRDYAKCDSLQEGWLACHDAKTVEELNLLHERYIGTPLEFLPEGMLLERENSRLLKSKNATEADWLQYKSSLQAYLDKYNKKGGDKTQALLKSRYRQIEKTLATLDASSVNPILKNDRYILLCRNVSYLDVSIKEEAGKEKAVARIDNPHKSFFVYDTLEWKIPELSDGRYNFFFECNGNDKTHRSTASSSYSQHRLSAATVLTGNGAEIFAVDYLIGKPVDKLDLYYGKNRYRDKKKVSRKELKQTPDGFFNLPEGANKYMSDSFSLYSYAESVDDSGVARRTSDLRLPNVYSIGQEREGSSVLLFPDKGAYRPGDSLRFKMIAFEGNPYESYRSLPSGSKITALLSDPDGAEVERIALETNSFGSASAGFLIPEDRNTGMWRLSFLRQGVNIFNRDIRVDDFTLPSFEVLFDPDRKRHISKDTIVVSGTVTSYSGHSLTDADMEVRVLTGGWKKDTLTVQKVALEPGGRFSFPYFAPQDGTYYFIFKVTDATGQTLEFDREALVSPYYTLEVELKEEETADYNIPKLLKDRLLGVGADQNGVIRSDTASFIVECIRERRKEVDLPFEYSFVNIKGDTLAKGEGLSGKEVVLYLSSYPDGLYVFSVETDEESDNPYGYVEYCLLKLKDESRLVDGVETYFDPLKTEIAEGEDIKIKLGAACGDVWIAAILSDDKCCIEKRIIHLDGKAGSGFEEITFPYPVTYPDQVRLNLLYFRGGQSVEYEQIYTRRRESLALKLESVEFQDDLTPSKTFDYKFKTNIASSEAVLSVFDRSADRFGRNIWNSLSLLSRTPVKSFRVFNGQGIVDLMIEDAESMELEDVVVIGYGVSSRGVSSRDDFVSALQGRVAGMQVSSTVASSEMRIRGVNSISAETKPLYLIDGLPVTEEEFNRLSPSQISSISILKDASATGIYGSRASNGVVVITTNKSGAGVKDVGSQNNLPDFSGISQRSDFRDVLSFQPHIQSKNGEITFSFKTSDRLSSYHLYLFVHTRDMHNAFFSKDITVSLPLKVSLATPKYLYKRDLYDISATVSAKGTGSYNGTGYILAYNGNPVRWMKEGNDRTPIFSFSEPATVAGGNSSSFHYTVAIPQNVDTLGLKAVFTSGDLSDAVVVSIPVRDDSQTLMEAHSAVLLNSSDRNKALSLLKSSFKTMSPDGARESLETYSQLLSRIILKESYPEGQDVISLMDALCFRNMMASGAIAEEKDSLMTEVLSFRDSTGGFRWFKDMEPSPVITAAVLERFACLRDAGYPLPEVASSIKYLDSSQFAAARAWWCGGLDNEEYMYVRSMFPEVSFKVETTEDRRQTRRNLSEFRRFARSYLSPSPKKDELPQFSTFDKALRIRTLQNLLATEKGMALGRGWGETILAWSKFKTAIRRDVEDLIDYAQHHPDGGVYYPNAVMPLKGQIDNEAYAHALISDVLAEYARSNKDSGKSASKQEDIEKAAYISDQLRLWLILQSQTQDWSKNLYFVNAVRSMTEASDSIKRISVLTLSKTESLRFNDIQKSGNGLQIERVFYRDSVISSGDGQQTKRVLLREGEKLHRGEKIYARYSIWSKENRSFVKVTAPREACLMPVNQLSGRYIGLKPILLDNWYRFTPAAYRSVRADRTEYYFDVLSEESVEIEEALYVVQDGVFSAPVVSVESLYAPAYRANDSFKGPLPVSR